MAKLKFHPDPSRNEYMSLVFYLERDLQGRAAAHLALTMASSVATLLRPPSLQVKVRGPDDVTSLDVGSFPSTKSVDAVLDGLPASIDDLSAGCDLRSMNAKDYVSIWSIDYDRGGKIQGNDNCTMDARLHMHINCCLFRPTRERVMRKGAILDVESKADDRGTRIVDECLSIMAGIPEAYYGHIEVASGGDTGCGLYYHNPDLAPGLTGPIPFHRLLNHVQWREAGADRRDHVRGVYWGNYFGPALARRFEPSGDEVRQFMEFSVAPSRNPPRPQWHRRFGNGALFLALSENPLDLAHFEPPLFNMGEAACVTAAWLHRRFAASGMVL